MTMKLTSKVKTLFGGSQSLIKKMSGKGKSLQEIYRIRRDQSLLQKLGGFRSR